MAASNTIHTFWLMQCGETTWAREGRLRGHTDLPMSNSGRSAVNADIVRLSGSSITTIHHPGDEAASEAALLVSEATGAKAKKVDDLADPDLGLLEGLTEQMFSDRYSKRFKAWREDLMALNPPDGENLSDARERLFTAMAKILKKSKNNEILFLLHPLAMGMCLCWLTNRPPDEFWTVMSEHSRLERYAMTADQLVQMVEAAQQAIQEAG
ncbi:MAG: histidine phosphatase family protein [Planctomycetota bacterium]|nr:histidine phosphatase family protein [Planctomycetota bacterium]